jgi:hypothetical protein
VTENRQRRQRFSDGKNKQEEAEGKRLLTVRVADDVFSLGEDGNGAEEDELVGDREAYGGGVVGEDVLELLRLQTFSKGDAGTTVVPFPRSARRTAARATASLKISWRFSLTKLKTFFQCPSLMLFVEKGKGTEGRRRGSRELGFLLGLVRRRGKWRRDAQALLVVLLRL